MTRFRAYLLYLIFGASAEAKLSLPQIKTGSPRARCRLLITQIRSPRLKDFKTLNLRARNRKDCERLGKRHRENFAPALVKKKIVEVQYE